MRVCTYPSGLRDEYHNLLTAAETIVMQSPPCLISQILVLILMMQAA